MRVGSQIKRIYYLAVNWILFCVADPLEQRRFTSIRPSDNEDTEVGVLGSEFRSFFRVDHSGCWRQSTASEQLLQAIAKSLQLGLFASLRHALVSHIDEGGDKLEVVH